MNKVKETGTTGLSTGFQNDASTGKPPEPDIRTPPNSHCPSQITASSF